MPASPTKAKRSLLLSVAGALFGVQSSARHSQDFQSSSALPYILAGIIGVVTFVVGLMLVVKLVLA
ncbi:DUF2970 domain-containing protein [Gallaecimonas sp. GXIMD4217]|uniref:DUF2970 domain-containing protein n=1 Tax=Gallaecimonas sp. GXIMD4217 TaxID=3131927 RepID=UPI00311AD954